MRKGLHGWTIRHVLIRMLLMVSTAAISHAQTPQAAGSDSTPELSGVWVGKPAGQVSFSKEQLPMQRRAEHDYRYNTIDAHNPSSAGRKQLDPHIVHCAPPGVPRLWLFDGPFEIIQKPEQIVIFYEEDHNFRQVWMNVSEHPKDFGHSWVGHSIGKWDGNTLVIDTVGLRKEPWLDNAGHVNSDELHLVERLNRIDQTHLKIDITFDDPKAFTRSWTGQRFAELVPNGEIRENVTCGDRIMKEIP